jgi:hypothetical protein
MLFLWVLLICLLDLYEPLWINQDLPLLNDGSFTCGSQEWLPATSRRCCWGSSPPIAAEPETIRSSRDRAAGPFSSGIRPGTSAACGSSTPRSSAACFCWAEWDQTARPCPHHRDTHLMEFVESSPHIHLAVLVLRYSVCFLRADPRVSRVYMPMMMPVLASTMGASPSAGRPLCLA